MSDDTERRDPAGATRAQQPLTEPVDESPGCYLFFIGAVLSVPAAVLGGVIVVIARDVRFGVDAGLAGLVVGLVVAALIARFVNSGTGASGEVTDLRSLPASERVGRGLRERRKVRLVDAVGEVAFTLVLILGAPVAAFLTGVVLLWLTRA